MRMIREPEDLPVSASHDASWIGLLKDSGWQEPSPFKAEGFLFCADGSELFASKRAEFPGGGGPSRKGRALRK